MAKSVVKTFPTMLKDGTAGRGVKVSLNGLATGRLGDWLGKAHGSDGINTSNIKVLAGPNYKQPRLAKVDDVIVKVGKGKDAYFLVVEAEDFEKYVKI